MAGLALNSGGGGMGLMGERYGGMGGLLRGAVSAGGVHMGGYVSAAPRDAQLSCDSSQVDTKPMDLSSGGGCSATGLAGVTQLLSRSIYGSIPDQLISARRLAELVRQQHRQSEDRDRSREGGGETRRMEAILASRLMENGGRMAEGGAELFRVSGGFEEEALRRRLEQGSRDLQIGGKEENTREDSVVRMEEWENNNEDQNLREQNQIEERPLDLIKCRLAEPISGAARRKSSCPGSPESPRSPAGSTSSSGSGREVKRRRLDALLNKKFDKLAAVGSNGAAIEKDENPAGSENMITPPTSLPDLSLIPISADPLTNTQMGGSRRHSIEDVTMADIQKIASPVNKRKQKRPSISQTPPYLNGTSSTQRDELSSPERKRSASPVFYSSPLRQASPSRSTPSMRSSSPPSLSIRPQSDLFPPAIATSTPNKMGRSSSPIAALRTSSPTPQRSSSPGSTSRPGSPQLSKQQDLLKNQLMQIQLSAALNNPEMLKHLQYNPLLYYTYYAQVLNNLQAQQKLLSGKPGDSENSPPPRGLGLPVGGALNPLNTSQLSNSNNNIKDFFSRHNFNKNKDVHRPYSPADSHSPATLSPLHFKDIDEPRKRAPRALTGRYVRTGTAASPRVLQLLRKKVEERLRLKEMLSNGGPHGIDKRAAFFSGFN